MNQTPLKDFEQKFESFIRLWMRYFYHIEDFILAIEILIDHKQAMLQKDFLEKDQVDGKRGRLQVLEELQACYILEKREYTFLFDQIQSINDTDNQEILKDKDGKKLAQFVNKSLKLLEDQLDSVLLAETKTDISKSMYYPDNYLHQLTQEKDDSLTFQIATEQLKVKQYARLYSFYQLNPIIIDDYVDIGDDVDDYESINNSNDAWSNDEGQMNENDNLAQPSSEQITQNSEKQKKIKKELIQIIIN